MKAIQGVLEKLPKGQEGVIASQLLRDFGGERDLNAAITELQSLEISPRWVLRLSDGSAEAITKPALTAFTTVAKGDPKPGQEVSGLIDYWGLGNLNAVTRLTLR